VRLLIMACRPRSAASAAPQALEGYLHWLRANFRAAGALRLDLTRARPPGAEVHVPAPEHGRHAGRLRALQLLLGGAGWTFDRAGWARGLVAASPHLAASPACTWRNCRRCRAWRTCCWTTCGCRPRCWPPWPA